MFFKSSKVLLAICIFLSCSSGVSAAAAVVNAPILANLRIEGNDSTIFEGRILTRGHNVTTPSGGTWKCDGTNNHANPCPGATCTSALADAAKKDHFPFDGKFFPEFDDFLITSIGDSTQTPTESWGLFVNFTSTIGGCQREVKPTDKILWAFNAYHKTLLDLSGPTRAKIHQQIVVTVIDGSTNATIKDAIVGGKRTDANGRATLTFDSVGLKLLKAERADSIRSNALEILVTADELYEPWVFRISANADDS